VDILQAIGNTSMVRLRKVVPSNGANVFVKLEWDNPTGSVKDRMARARVGVWAFHFQSLNH
jgi:cysteine synthase A